MITEAKLFKIELAAEALPMNERTAEILK